MTSLAGGVLAFCQGIRGLDSFVEPLQTGDWKVRLYSEWWSHLCHLVLFYDREDVDNKRVARRNQVRQSLLSWFVRFAISGLPTVYISVATSQPECVPTEVEKLWQATKAKQQNNNHNGTQLLNNCVEFVGTKATNHGRCFIFLKNVEHHVNTIEVFTNIRPSMHANKLSLSSI